MLKFKIMPGSFVLFFFITSCTTMQSRDEQEKEMLTLLKKMAPIAQEINEIKYIPKQMQEKALSGDKQEVTKLRLAYAAGIPRMQNLSAELQPYQYQYNGLKYKYINTFGVVEYNEFIKKNGFFWGLGIYW